MKIVSFFILCSATFLLAGGADRPLSSGQEHRNGRDAASSVIQQAASSSALDDLGGLGSGSSLWDEEDTLDDDLSDTALQLPSLFDLHGRAGLASWAGTQDRVLRSPDLLIPLRC
jgi:hypothetical protein